MNLFLCDLSHNINCFVKLSAALTASSDAATSANEGSLKLLREALGAIGPQLNADVITRLFQPVLEELIFGERRVDEAAVHALFKEAMSLCPEPPAVLCCQYLRWAYTASGIFGAKKVYSQIMGSYPGGSENLVPLIAEYIALSQNGALSDTETRSAFEAALRCAKKSSDISALSRSYSQFESDRQQYEKAEAIRWRYQNAEDGASD